MGCPRSVTLLAVQCCFRSARRAKLDSCRPCPWGSTSSHRLIKRRHCAHVMATSMYKQSMYFWMVTVKQPSLICHLSPCCGQAVCHHRAQPLVQHPEGIKESEQRPLLALCFQPTRLHSCRWQSLERHLDTAMRSRWHTEIQRAELRSSHTSHDQAEHKGGIRARILQYRETGLYGFSETFGINFSPLIAVVV